MKNIKVCCAIRSEADSGIYQLLVRLARPTTVTVGKLGQARFKAGWYVYTGSAKRNLGWRLARHLGECGAKRLRWHIDYLLVCPEAKVAAWRTFRFRCRRECDENLKLLESAATVPMRGFGSSDCRRCPAHLLLVDGSIVRRQTGWVYLSDKAANWV